MNNTTVKGVFLLVSLMMFAGSVSALDVDGFGRRVSNPREVILAHDAQLPDVSFRLVGSIDADVLNFRSGKVINQVEGF